MKKAFTLIELAVAVGLLAMVMAFSSIIFKVTIESHRTAGANAEIMQKLRAITDQLNTDFKALRKDGYLILHSQLQDRMEYKKDLLAQDFRTDRLYYFTTGDFQSWFPPNVRSNIARAYFGHDHNSLDPLAGKFASQWRLARDANLVTPDYNNIDCNSLSFSQSKADPNTLVVANVLLGAGVFMNIQNPDDVRSLMCQDVGEIIIEWTDGTWDANNFLLWYGLSRPRKATDPNNYNSIENTIVDYTATWKPDTPERYFPRALKFTFRIYDSKAILEHGRKFTHIVYLDD